MMDLPTRKTEYWRYTPLAKLWHGKNLTQLTQGKAVDTKPVIDGVRIQLVDGQFIAHDDLPKGVTIKPLDKTPKFAIDYQKHVLAPYAEQMNSAGVMIDIADNTELTRPIILEHHITQPGIAHHRHHIVIGKNAAVTMIEAPQIAKDGVANILTTVINGAQSRYRHYVLTDKTNAGSYISGLHCDQQDNSEVFYFCDSRHHALARYDVHAHLNAPGAHCTTSGTYHLADTQHADHHILIEHHASHTASMQRYKGIVDDKAHAVFNGGAIAHAGTHQIDAHQHNHNLLLSNHAEVDTKPELEIYTDTVTCTHGATVGQLDENMLFYCQSRGIDLDTARAMLTAAFTQDIVTTIPDKEVRTWLIQ